MIKLWPQARKPNSMGWGTLGGGELVEDAIQEFVQIRQQEHQLSLQVVGVDADQFAELATRLNARVVDAWFAPIITLWTASGPVLVTLREVLRG
jgi:hypothetical protein